MKQKFTILTFCGGVAQLGERGVRNAEVRGSNPLISTILSIVYDQDFARNN